MSQSEWVTIAAGPVPIRYGAHEGEWSKQVLQNRDDIGTPYDGAVFCELYEAVTAAYDEHQRRRRQEGEARDRETMMRDRDRTQVDAAELLAGGESMIDVPAILNFDSYATFLSYLLGAAGAGRSDLRNWGDHDWLKWEAYLENLCGEPAMPSRCATAMGKSRSLERLFKFLLTLYGHPIKGAVQRTTEDMLAARRQAYRDKKAATADERAAEKARKQAERDRVYAEKLATITDPRLRHRMMRDREYSRRRAASKASEGVE